MIDCISQISRGGAKCGARGHISTYFKDLHSCRNLVRKDNPGMYCKTLLFVLNMGNRNEWNLVGLERTGYEARENW